MIVFCSFEQMPMVIEKAKKHGFNHNIPLIFIKNFSAQVLKANMRIVGATEYALVLYREKLPKFNNGGEMIFNWFPMLKDTNWAYLMRNINYIETQVYELMGKVVEAQRKVEINGVCEEPERQEEK